MFTNLIESSSHVQEYKRRGSFLLFTGATYVVLFVITGVVSIYAYDARLEQQILDDVTLVSPHDFIPEPVSAPAANPDRPRNTDNNDNALPERAIAMLDVDRPEVVPDEVSATPSKHLPLPPHGKVLITGRDVNPGSMGGPGAPYSGGRQVVQSTQVVEMEEPPPPPEPPKPAKVISKGVITSQALSLPKPVYPEAAKRMRIQGTVSVQVLIDEEGHVISAKAVSGSPFLSYEAQKAAFQARFSPTRLGDRPVKVSGVITYNFVLNN